MNTQRAEAQPPRPAITTDSPISTAAPTPAALTATPTSSVPSTAIPTKPQRILACVLCQHRKIKCDRSFPCANCLKANVTCTPSTPAPARKRRRPNQDLQERLARCEELLKEYATAKPPSPPPANPPSPKPDGIPELEDPIPKWKPAGKLFEEDGGVRFMDSYLLTTVYDELKSMRKIVDEEITCDESTPMPIDDTANSPDDNSDLLFGGEDSPSTNIEDLSPTATQIVRLWQIYLDRCNPLTKIIHVPTVQPYLLDATKPSPQLPRNVEALLFSIYTLATVSMSKDECQEILGTSRDKALARFGQGVRLTLRRMGFLKTHDLLTLQALVIYLISLQGRYNRHASWILNGVVIRVAQKMGLHRDGELLGLKPFETEMRRRLWWQIIMVDAKYAMMSGLSHALLPRGWDTKEPKNISDEDLVPSTTEPISDTEGPTDMILTLTIFKLAKSLIRLPGIETILLINEMEATRGTTSLNKAKVAEYRAVVVQLDRDLDEMFERFSPPGSGPLHDLARQLKQHLMGKLMVLAKPPAESPDWGTEVFDHTSNAFKLAVDTTCHAVEQYKMASYPGWDWFSRLHFQLDIFAYLVGQLSYRTTGRLVDKAWQVVEDVYKYHPEFYEISQKLYYQLSYFIFKAWRKREEAIRAKLGQAPEVPRCVQKLRMMMPGSDDASVKSEAGKTPNADIFNQLMATTGFRAGPSDPMDTNVVEAMPFDAYMGNYFDFNDTLDFGIWGNAQDVATAVPGPTELDQNIRLQDMESYGMPYGSTWN
ncbi:fungal-specific transcription factor domain-domain-containing protein [Coniella lustricola]|uniref:Fungal-specific transcription factor domain-domain-containing protein n=1 Tax=Coniella lustricola TaxID=2025994 RepID=A0A2T3AJI2_9PEZI|nr:fungal-specific transcription factor domain-domain-containing protein [Coniella lustricola]